MKLSPLINLDFEQTKLFLKFFIKTNTKFSDYDYAGSNINQLLDVLAYVTFVNSYNLNIGLNELRLSTALLRDSVQMIAGELGYTPNNYSSSRVDVNLNFVVENSVKFIELPVGSILVGSNGSNSYKFNVIDRKITSANNIQLTLSEGTLITQNFVYGGGENDRIILTNDRIDIDSIRIRIGGRSYKKAVNIVNNDKFIFFVTLIQDNNIEIEFGKNIFGIEPELGDVVEVSYLVNNGSAANDIANFTFVGEIKKYYENDVAGTIIPISDITYNVGASYGGTDTETLKNIKFNATKTFVSQGRAITSVDYQNILLQNFPNIKTVKVIGGEELSPPTFGKIKLVVQTKTNTKLSSAQKANIVALLKNYNITTIPIIEDAKTLKLRITPYIKYDLKLLPISIDDLINAITNTISSYVTNHDMQFYGNKLESLIYQIDPAIVSVKIKVVLIDSVVPNTSGNYSGSMGGLIKNDNCKLFSFMTNPFNIGADYYRLVSVGSDSIITRQKYTNGMNGYEWENDGVAGQINATTGDYSYNVPGITTEINNLVVSGTLDVESNKVIQPEINPPVMGTDVINNDLTTEPELKNPPIKIGGNVVDTVLLTDIIPIISTITC